VVDFECLTLYDAVRVKFGFSFRLYGWLSLFVLRYVGIRNIVFKTKKPTKPAQLGDFFFAFPQLGFFSLVLTACRGDVYCQCSGPRQAWAGTFAGRVNFEAPGNSVPEEHHRHWVMAGRRPNGWGEHVE